MKRYCLTLVVLSMLTAASCSHNHQPKKTNAADEKKTKIVKHYTCTMHPSVVDDKPGVCPKCGMELVEKK